MTNDNENNGRYGTNRNLWRKVYSYARRKPAYIQIADLNVATGVTSSTLRTIDANKTYRHRDYFKIQGAYSSSYLATPTGALPSEVYEEGLIFFNNELIKTASFSKTFPYAPYVVYSVDPTINSSSNINTFGMSVPTKNQMIVGVSAHFSGNVRYRAAFASSWPYIFPSGSTPYTASALEIHAQSTNLTNSVDVTASYSVASPFDVSAIEYRSSFHDSVGDQSVDVSSQKVSASSTVAIHEFSAPVTNQVHLMYISASQ